MQARCLAARADRLQISHTEEYQSISMCFTWFMWKPRALFKAERTLFSTMLYPELLQTRVAKAQIAVDAAEDHRRQEDFCTHGAAGLVHTQAWDVDLHLWNSMQHWLGLHYAVRPTVNTVCTVCTMWFQLVMVLHRGRETRTRLLWFHHK